MPASSQLLARNAASSGCTYGPTFANATPNFIAAPPCWSSLAFGSLRETCGSGARGSRRDSIHALRGPQRFEIGAEKPPARIPAVARAPPLFPARVERRELRSAAVVDLAPVRPPAVCGEDLRAGAEQRLV